MKRDVQRTRPNAKAMRILKSGLNDDVHTAIRSCDSSNKIWTRILGMFEQKSATNKYLLNKELIELKFKGGQSVASYCSNLAVIGQKLEAAGETISDASLIAKLVNDLPEPYGLFKQTYLLQAAAGTVLSMADLQMQLLLIEASLDRAALTGQEDAGDAFLAKKVWPKAGQNIKQRKETRECFHCKIKGHIKRDCRKWKAEKEKGHEKEEGLMALNTSHRAANVWVADSGATSHMAYDVQSFSTLTKLDKPAEVTIGDGRTIEAVAKGTIAIEAFDGQHWNKRPLLDVLLVPDLGQNLFSLCAVTDRGHKVQMDQKNVAIYSGSRKLLVGHRTGRSLYELQIRLDNEEAHLATATLKEWHENLAHISPERIKVTERFNAANGLVIAAGKDEDKLFCPGCAQGKMAKKPYGQVVNQDAAVGDRIHSDLCGPMEVTSIGGAKYSVTYKDEVSGYRKVYFIKSKEQVLETLRFFVAEQRAERGQVMKCLRTDNGTEYKNSAMKEYLAMNKIVHETHSKMA